MNLQIKKIIIENLHGEITYKINITNNKLIIVSENGRGKTTLVNIIYYTLSRQWEKLTEYNFKKIVLDLNETEITIEREELYEFIKIRRLKTRGLKSSSGYRNRRIFEHISLNYEMKSLLGNPKLIENLSDEFEIPSGILYDYIYDSLQAKQIDLYSESFKTKDNYIKSAFKAQILYLPTYRRIEQDLKYIFPDLDADMVSYRQKRKFREKLNNSYIELVEFGMDDVEENINDRLTELSNNFASKLKQILLGSFLKDVLNKSYRYYQTKSIEKFSLETLNNVLERIDKSILDDSDKENLIKFVRDYVKLGSFTEEDRIIAHFITKLLEIYEEQEKEERDIENFVNICQVYIRNKIFLYSREDKTIKIYLTNGEQIRFGNLSSGEKQIVSLFSQIYLSGENKFFIIIDEPELSLSVVWQERLINDILATKKVIGLIAVTHSPFIFKNNLQNITHGLEEFIEF